MLNGNNGDGPIGKVRQAISLQLRLHRMTLPFRISRINSPGVAGEQRPLRTPGELLTLRLPTSGEPLGPTGGTR